MVTSCSSTKAPSTTTSAGGVDDPYRTTVVPGSSVVNRTVSSPSVGTSSTSLIAGPAQSTVAWSVFSTLLPPAPSSAST